MLGVDNNTCNTIYRSTLQPLLLFSCLPADILFHFQPLAFETHGQCNQTATGFKIIIIIIMLARFNAASRNSTAGSTATAFYGGGGNFLRLATAYELYGGLRRLTAAARGPRLEPPICSLG